MCASCELLVPKYLFSFETLFRLKVKEASERRPNFDSFEGLTEPIDQLGPLSGCIPGYPGLRFAVGCHAMAKAH